MTRRLALILVVLPALALIAGCGDGMPSPSSEEYAEAVTAFYTGVAALEVGEDRRAEELLLRVVDLAPGEAAAWADLGLLALRRNELDLALERLVRARDLAPAESRIHFLLGMAEATRGNAEAAIEHFGRAREANPRNVRAIYALIEQVETLGGAGATTEVRDLIDAILEVQPNNLAVLVEKARFDAIAGDAPALRATLERIDAFSGSWSDETRQQLAAVRMAMTGGDASDAITELTFFSNVLKRESAYRETLAAVSAQPGQPTELIGEFLALPVPRGGSAPADEELSFETSSLFTEVSMRSWRWVRAVSVEGRPMVVAGAGPSLYLEDGTRVASPGPIAGGGLIVTDYDYDFEVDLGLAGTEGFRLLRGADGGFTDVTPSVDLPAEVLSAAYAAGWAADIDMEGDLDLVLARVAGSPAVLRNDGDGTFTPTAPFEGVTDVRAFVWADLDGDGDPDAAFAEASGEVRLAVNHRSQGFEIQALPTSARALVAADLDKDGVFELLFVTPNGEIGYRSTDGTTSSIGTIEATADARLFAADVDNNGDVDVVASSERRTAIFLGSDDGSFLRLDAPVGTYALADVSGGGRLDLLGIGEAGGPVRLRNEGTMEYHSATLRPLAAQATGDQRINPFGLGGEIEVRSGLLYQKQSIAEPVVHVGLGRRDLVELVRIVWPNGDIQAEFELPTDEIVEARQRLKGSCPWLFAFDGEKMAFVTDFIWRSPLGLRINAQETAGVMMTEDRVKIDGREIVPRDGVYDVRITAELWETHFFDHVSLMVVDHPVGTDVYVDERFAYPPPDLSVRATAEPVPVRRVTDDRGRDVTSFVQEADEQYLASFEIGQYQGIAKEHTLEIDLSDAPAEGPLQMIATGWIRPTDSSINVALSQGASDPPAGLRLDVPDGHGGWTTVYPNLGFPAGKFKTVLFDLTGIFPAEQTVRLTTNLEIYWDAISWARGLPETELRTRRLAPSLADLRYRGYSVVVEPDRTHPEVPLYDSLAATSQVWQDLEGYYTRFGDVRELLRDVDDRYVIVNAGDELRFEFEALDDPPAGWTRDFVLVGDGWVKDGDYNTTFSESVLPLPAHDSPDYAGPRGPLEEDPVYRRHAADWRTFHTRYVTNRALSSR